MGTMPKSLHHRRIGLRLYIDGSIENAGTENAKCGTVINARMENAGTECSWSGIFQSCNFHPCIFVTYGPAFFCPTFSVLVFLASPVSTSICAKSCPYTQYAKQKKKFYKHFNTCMVQQ